MCWNRVAWIRQNKRRQNNYACKIANFWGSQIKGFYSICLTNSIDIRLNGMTLSAAYVIEWTKYHNAKLNPANFDNHFVLYAKFRSVTNNAIRILQLRDRQWTQIHSPHHQPLKISHEQPPKWVVSREKRPKAKAEFDDT